MIEILNVEDPSGISIRHVVITREDGSSESFPVDENNERYQQWVAEGNDPDAVGGE